MPITALPPAPSRATDSAADFSTKADALLGALGTFVTQTNALAAAMAAFAAGGAMTIPYTFSTTTADADPGAGNLRLDNATQNIATTIRADLAGSDGSTWTSVLDTFDDSTSTIKGFILLQATADATKWLLFSVSALASPAGYKNITVANVASSAASPFADGASVVLKFTRNGDKGDAGVSALPGDHAVTVTTGNGMGSVNTMVRRFSTTQSSVGTSITYADSATLGASFTINESALYEIYYSDIGIGTGTFHGVSLNSAQLTTAIASITAADRLTYCADFNATQTAVSRTVKLTAGDVVRPHCGGTYTSVAATICFSIRKVANV